MPYSLLRGVFLTSCEKEESLTKPETKTETTEENYVEVIPTVDEGITSKDGILIFKNRETLNQFIKESALKTPEEIAEWENSHGFISLQRIFETALKEDEYRRIEIEDRYSVDQIIQKTNESSTFLHFKYTLKNIKNGILKLNKKGKTVFSLNTNAPYYSKVLNSNGVVVISDTIFQYVENNLKLITDNDFSKLKILPFCNETDKKMNIIVAKLDESKVYGYSATFETYENIKNYRKVLASLSARRWVAADYISTDYYIQITCYRNHWLWGWIGDSMSTEINGYYRWGRLNSNNVLEEYHFANHRQNKSIVSETILLPAPNNGTSYTGHPYDPLAGYFDFIVTGGGVSFDFRLDHTTGLGYW